MARLQWCILRHGATPPPVMMVRCCPVLGIPAASSLIIIMQGRPRRAPELRCQRLTQARQASQNSAGRTGRMRTSTQHKRVWCGVVCEPDDRNEAGGIGCTHGARVSLQRVHSTSTHAGLLTPRGMMSTRSQALSAAPNRMPATIAPSDRPMARPGGGEGRVQSSREGWSSDGTMTWW